MRGRRPLVGWVAVAGLTAVALGGLGALFVEARSPGPEQAPPGRDALAVAYLRVLVRNRPADGALRLRLSREELAIGSFGDADRALAPLLDQGASPSREALWLSVEIALGAWRAAPSTPADRVLARLDRVLGTDASLDDLSRAAGVARELRRPDVAGRAGDRAASLDAPRCARWLTQAARDFLAAGDPRSAAASSARAYGCSGSGEEARALGLAALQAQLGAEQGAQALRLTEALLERFPADREILEIAEQIALAQGDPARARRFAASLCSLGAADPGRLRRLLDLHLAVGDLDGAAQAANQLACSAPADLDARLTAARVAEWAGHLVLALDHWRWLARHGHAALGTEGALRLARAIPDHAAVAEMLVLTSRRRALSPASLRELAQALDRTGPPGAALAALADHAARHPESRTAWEALAGLQEERGAMAAALDARAEIARRFGPSVESSLEVARLQWAVGRPDRALAELERWSDSADPAAAGYWELLGELAWSQESDVLAARAYRALWNGGRISSLGAERLILLQREAGRQDDVIRLGREGWARFGEPRLLLLAMDEATRGHRWDDLLELEAAAAGAESAFSRLPAYWMLRARLDEQGGRTADAVEAHLRALDADPGSAATRSSLIWLLVRTGDRAALARWLPLWRVDAEEDPALWRPYAAGLDLLGRHQEALAFYAREARADPDDAGAQARYRRAVAAAAAASQGSAPRRPSAAFRGELAVQSLGPVMLRRAEVGAGAGRAEGEIELRAGVIDIASALPEPAAGQQSIELGAAAAWDALGGRTELLGGVRVERGRIAPQGAVAHARRLAPAAEIRLEAAANERATESADLLLDGSRSRAGGALTLAAGGAYGRGGVEWKAWWRDAGEHLGSAVASTLEIGWRPRTADPQITLRLQGAHQRSWAAAPSPEPFMPEDLRMLGLGASAAHWRVGPAVLLADAWLGWISNPDRPAYRFQAGLELAPIDAAHLSLTAYAANDQWGAASGDFGVNASVSYRLPWPTP